jgi:hypothetical protein
LNDEIAYESGSLLARIHLNRTIDKEYKPFFKEIKEKILVSQVKATNDM